MKLSSLLSDHMVLQRERNNPVWGRCGRNMKVSVKAFFKDEEVCSVSARSDDEGDFSLFLPPLKPGGPYRILIESETEEKSIGDVLSGDVFLLSGQSNMELPIRRTLDLTADYVSGCHNPSIRLFEVPKEYDFNGPVSDIHDGCWIKAGRENILAFPAIGFFFAEHVFYDEGVPVGLVQTACGGIQIEALIPEKRLVPLSQSLIREALKRGESREKNCRCNTNKVCKFCVQDIIKQDKDQAFVRGRIKEDEEKTGEYLDRLDKEDIGLKEGFRDRQSLFEKGEKISTITVPGRWEGLIEYPWLERLRGTAWLLFGFEAAEDDLSFNEDNSAKLVLGTVIDADETYLNGVLIGETTYRYPPRRYEIPAGLLKKKNTLTIRVKALNRAGGFVEEMPYYVECGKNRISLEGRYEFKIGANLNPRFSEDTPDMPDTTFFLYRPCGMYNRMIYPLRRLSLKAMLFYQGESNCAGYGEYAALMEEMVSSVRECFDNPGLLVVFAKLPYFGGEDEGRATDEWENLRLAQQQAAQRIPNCAVAELYDLGFRYELHPQTKKEAADRFYEAYVKIFLH